MNSPCGVYTFRNWLGWHAAILVGFCFAGQASAHQKWLWPNRFSAEKAPVWISFDATWSDEAFTPDEGVHDRPLFVVDPEGRSSSPDRVFVGKTKSTAEAELTREGTYRIESVDPLTYWSQVEKDGETQWLKKSKTEVTDLKVLRADLYWSEALAYVTVGETKDAPPYPENDPLSIVPGVHPNAIDAGQPVELKVSSYGKPVAGAELKVFDPAASGHDAEISVKCDKNGVASLPSRTPANTLSRANWNAKKKTIRKPTSIRSTSISRSWCDQSKSELRELIIRERFQSSHRRLDPHEYLAAIHVIQD